MMDGLVFAENNGTKYVKRLGVWYCYDKAFPGDMEKLLLKFSISAQAVSQTLAKTLDEIVTDATKERLNSQIAEANRRRLQERPADYYDTTHRYPRGPVREH